MLLLVTDTSGKNGCVALARAANCSDFVEVIESVPLAGGTFSAQLVPQISALLEKHKFSKSDIDGFIVVSGPGSFTGLRVGLAVIKALAEVLAKPIVPVSLLEALAMAAASEGPICTLMDAGRGEVYAGEYVVENRAVRRVREELVSKEEFLRRKERLIVITPDSALAELVHKAGFPKEEVGLIGAETIARLGVRKLRAGGTVSAEKLDANYVRSDAEIFGKLAPSS